MHLKPSISKKRGKREHRLTNFMINIIQIQKHNKGFTRKENEMHRRAPKNSRTMHEHIKSSNSQKDKKHTVLEECQLGLTLKNQSILSTILKE